MMGPWPCLSPYSCYKAGDKSWMRKGPGSVYKWNISLVICDTYIIYSIKLSKWWLQLCQIILNMIMPISVTRLTRLVPQVEQELLPFGYTPFLVGFFSFMCMFCRSLFVLFLLAIVLSCPSSIYGFWLPFWYLQTLLCHNIYVLSVKSVQFFLQ
jgi:hypothetical protein